MFGRGNGDNALMRGVTGHAVEFHAGEKAHGDAELAAVFDHALQADIVPLFRHADPLESASAGLEGFGDSVDAVDIVHEVSVYRKTGCGAGAHARVTSSAG